MASKKELERALVMAAKTVHKCCRHGLCPLKKPWKNIHGILFHGCKVIGKRDCVEEIEAHFIKQAQAKGVE